MAAARRCFLQSAVIRGVFLRGGGSGAILSLARSLSEVPANFMKSPLVHVLLSGTALSLPLSAFGADESGAPVSVAASTSESSDAASDSSWRLHGSLVGARALSGYQKDELGFGGGALVALEWGPSPKWGLQLEGGWLGLTGAGQVPPTGLQELTGEDAALVSVGARFRPFAPPEKWLDAAGLWLSAAGGMAITGGRVAPALDAMIGYDIFPTNHFGIGPTVGYQHIFQVGEAPRSGDASVLLFGLHATFDFAEERERIPPPPPDRDGDGILDEQDRCPETPEDVDGFEDEDGCPEPDNDGDGLNDSVDQCPNDAEDVDGFEDEDGCPEADNDGDEILDAVDSCKNEPEDRDGFEDEDGCPDLDNDGDKIPDDKDLCPNEPETLNGYSDNDGCPDTESVRVVGDKIELDQKIHFWSNSSKIRGMSYPVLDKLARFLIDHPEYTHISVEGHADSRGPDELNQQISAARAASVRDFLVSKGIVDERVSSQGFGESKPLVDAENEHAWFMNRRVEFVVTRERVVQVGPASDVTAAPGAIEPSSQAGGAPAESNEAPESVDTEGSEP